MSRLLHTAPTAHVSSNAPLFDHFYVIGVRPPMAMAAAESRRPVPPECLFEWPSQVDVGGKRRASTSGMQGGGGDVAPFCFPSGVEIAAVVGTQSGTGVMELLRGRSSARSPRCFVFRLTGADGEARYGVALQRTSLVGDMPAVVAPSKLEFRVPSPQLLAVSPLVYCIVGRRPLIGIMSELLMRLADLDLLHRDASPGMLQYAIRCSERMAAAALGASMALNGGDEENRGRAGSREEDDTDDDGPALDELEVPEEPPKRSYISQSLGRMSRRRSRSRERSPDHRRGRAFSRGEHEVIDLDADGGWMEPQTLAPLRFAVRESRQTVREHESKFPAADTYAAGDSTEEFERKSRVWREFCAKRTAALLEVAKTSKVPGEGDIFRVDAAAEVSSLWYTMPDLEAVSSISDDSTDEDRRYVLDMMLLAEHSVPVMFAELSLQTIMQVLSAALLEKQILVVCSDTEVLSSVCIGLLTLMGPFKWPSVFIPVLPETLAVVVEAPTPYILGMESIPEDVTTDGLYILDVFDDHVTAPVREPLFTARLPQASTLMGDLKHAHSAMRNFASGRSADAPVLLAHEVVALCHMFFADTLFGNIRQHTITNVNDANDRVSVFMAESFLEVEVQHKRDHEWMEKFLQGRIFNEYFDDSGAH